MLGFNDVIRRSQIRHFVLSVVCVQKDLFNIAARNDFFSDLMPPFLIWQTALLYFFNLVKRRWTGVSRQCPIGRWLKYQNTSERPDNGT